MFHTHNTAIPYACRLNIYLKNVLEYPMHIYVSTNLQKDSSKWSPLLLDDLVIDQI